MTADEEIVFEILGEGGSLEIARLFDNNVEAYHYHHNEGDLFEKDLAISKNGVYDNFEEPFGIINKKYPWYLLNIQTVHQDFKVCVLNALVNQLNKKQVTQSEFEHSKAQFEEVLGIKIHFGKVPFRDGFQEIIVKLKVGKTTSFEYQDYSGHYHSSNTKNDDLKISQSTETFDLKEYKFKGKLEIFGPTVVIKDYFNIPQFVFSAEQAIVITKPILTSSEGWFHDTII